LPSSTNLSNTLSAPEARPPVIPEAEPRLAGRGEAIRDRPITDSNRTFAEWTAEFDCAPARAKELAQNIGQGVFSTQLRCA